MHGKMNARANFKEKFYTDRLILRRFSIDDVGDVFMYITGSKEVTKFMPWFYRDSIEDTKMLVQDWRFNDNLLCIEFQHRAIGFISISPDEEENSCYIIGYAIGKEFWNRGIATEALKATLNYIFTNTDIVKIKSCHDILNPASGEVMKKAGMKYVKTCEDEYMGRVKEAKWYEMDKDTNG